MADFKTAFALTSKWEGGYVNNPADTGGETYRGISRKNWPSWPGWVFIDRKKPLKYGALITDDTLDFWVERFYEDNFWQKIKGDEVNNQSIANILFDWTVTSGSHAIKAIQKLVGANPDGAIGPITIDLINKSDQKMLFVQLLNARELFYEKICQLKPSQKVFLRGWLNRTNSFTFQ